MSTIENRGQPPRRNSGVPSLLLPLGFLLAALALVVCTLPTLMSSPEEQALAMVGGPFHLADGRGHMVTEKSWPGRFLLIYFGYTHCPSACPTTLASMSDALDRLGRGADRVQPLFITVDPARDTAASIGRYVALFSPRLDGLTGTETEIDEARSRYRIYAARHRIGPGAADYEMDHSHIVYLMSPAGHLSRTIAADASPAAMSAAIGSALRRSS